MKYVVKANDGAYMRYPGIDGNSHRMESGWNAALEAADLFNSIEDAKWWIENWGFGKWETACVVAVTIQEVEVKVKNEQAVS